MAKAKSLEDFLKQKRGLTNPNSPDTLSEYIQKSGIEATRNYTSAVRDAINKSRANYGKYGTRAEKIGRAGLSGGGYSEYLSEVAGTKRLAETDAAREKMEGEYLKAQGEFQSYLEKHRAAATGRMQSLEKQLVKFGIMRLDETYAIGIDYGLSPEDAATVSATVYRTLRDETFDKCIRAAQSSYMNESTLRSYAERVGLLAEDIETLVWEAGKYLDKGYGNG